MYRCIFNHFYVIGPKSYRIRRNNANFTAITPFKVIQGHRFGTNRKPICDFLLLINTNSPPILHRFQVIADYWSNFRYRHGSDSLYNAPAVGEPLRISAYSHTLYLSPMPAVIHYWFESAQAFAI